MRIFWLALLPLAGVMAQTASLQWDFEGANPLAGWSMGSTPQNAGIRIVAANQGCLQGQQCVALSSPALPPANSFGYMSYLVQAAPYVGSVIRFRSAIRPADLATATYPWVTMESDSASLSFARSGVITGVINSQPWRYAQLDVPVPAGATRIVVGFVIGAGQAWVDDASLTVLKAGQIGPPRPLSNTGLGNLTALARMLGGVRHFHPSDQMVAVDWNQFTVQGVRAIEGAATPQDLAGALQTLFNPIAPTVRVFAAGAMPGLPTDLLPASTAGLQIVKWFNYGVGLGASTNLYYSERQTALASGGLQAGFQDPTQPYIVDLGLGLFAMIPLTVYSDAQGTLPHRSYSQPTPEALVPEDRAARLAGVILAWSVVQNFYPYFDVVDTDWPAVLSAALTSAATDSGAAGYMVTLERLVAAQKDGHGYVWQTVGAPATYMAPLIWDWVENQLVVTYLKDGQQQGMAPGDRVLKIDGKPAEGVIAAQEQLISGATPQWIRYRALNAIAICDGQTRRMQLEFEPYASPGATRTAQFACGTDTNWVEPRGGVVQQLEPGIVYVDLNRATDADWTAALPSLEAANGIVLDMRGYPQTSSPLVYLSQTPLDSEQLCTPEPPKPDRVDLTFTKEGWTLPPMRPYLSARRVYLTDGRAVSWAETISGIVEYYKLAEIVGAPTAGTDGDINFNDLPGGFRVSFTGMKVLKQDGSQYHGVGVHPAVPASRTRSGIAAGKDELLLRGLDVVKWPLPGPTPAITAKGIVNAANYTGGAVTPGEMATIFGSNLGPAQPALGTYDLSGYLSSSAGDVKVFFDDIQAPLVYASSTQVSAIVPYRVTNSTTIHVEVQGRSSNLVTLPVAAAAPGIFTGILNRDGSANSQFHAAARGEVVTLYATGEGPTLPAGLDGVRPKAGKWPSPGGELSVTIGGVPADVSFKGEVYAGVLQVNVAVPAAVQPGASVPVVLTVSGKSSGGATAIAVK